jgi:hypothetical protein
MAVRHFLCGAGLFCLCALGQVGLAAASDHEEAAGPVAAQVGTGAMQAALAEMLSKAFRPHSRRKPEWVQRKPEMELDAELHSIGRESWQLVLQQERRDGAELLTFRLPLADSGALRSYAGAGLNQSRYYRADDFGFTRFSRRNRQRSLGAAAEVGAEFAIGKNVRIGADLRWIELDDRAVALQSEGRLVSADPLMLGLSLGCRF